MCNSLFIGPWQTVQGPKISLFGAFVLYKHHNSASTAPIYIKSSLLDASRVLYCNCLFIGPFGPLQHSHGTKIIIVWALHFANPSLWEFVGAWLSSWIWYHEKMTKAFLGMGSVNERWHNIPQQFHSKDIFCECDGVSSEPGHSSDL